MSWLVFVVVLALPVGIFLGGFVQGFRDKSATPKPTPVKHTFRVFHGD